VWLEKTAGKRARQPAPFHPRRIENFARHAELGCCCSGAVYRRVLAWMHRSHGGGSDYQPFLDHVGVASMSFSFSGTSGSYHSAYDDLWRMATYGDTNYTHRRSVPRDRHAPGRPTSSPSATRMPRRSTTWTGSAPQVQLYGQEMVGFDREVEQAQAWHDAAEELEDKVDALIAANASVSPKLANEFAFINKKLIGQERDLTQAKGLPGRPWYRHMIYSNPLRLHRGPCWRYDHCRRLAKVRAMLRCCTTR
jgi:hypothetical protein